MENIENNLPNRKTCLTKYEEALIVDKAGFRCSHSGIFPQFRIWKQLHSIIKQFNLQKASNKIKRFHFKVCNTCHPGCEQVLI